MGLKKKVVWLPYDFDTAIGINNEGALTFSYNLEDTDHTESGADVYNGQQSVMWTNLRDAFGPELTAMYKQLRSDGVLSYGVVERMFEEHQSKWPEAIFNEDSEFKYIMPLTNPEDGNPTAAYLSMLQGSKADQRKWWLYNRFRYLDSKYNAGDALTDVITLRGYAKDNITIIPYADIYPTIKFGSYLVGVRGERGNAYTLVCPLDKVNDTEIYIYSASQLASIGDISGLKVGFADFSMGTKLQNLKIGDSDANYSNANLVELYIGNNTLLKTIDVRNCPALGTGDQKTVDLSGCRNVEEVYFDGTSIGAVNLPNGGILRVLHLPGTVSNLTIRNQPELTDLTVTDYSHISTLWLEKAGFIDSKEIVKQIASGGRSRLIGIDWEMEDETELTATFDIINSQRGLDENGNNVEIAQLTGDVYTPIATRYYMSQLESRYPYVNFTADELYTLIKTYFDRALTSYSNSSITTLRPCAFYRQTKLTSVSLPNVKSIGHDAFGYTRFTTIPIDLSNVTSIGVACFANSGLTHVTLDGYNMVQSMFSGCTSLKWIEFSSSYSGNIALYGVQGCSALEKMFIRKTSGVIAIANTTYSLSSTPFAGVNGLIGTAYVPESLISTYQAATTWSKYYTNGTCIFKAIEDYTTDGTVNGEIDWTKIEAEEAA